MTELSLQPPFKIKMEPNPKGAPYVMDSGGRTICYGTGFWPSEVRQLEDLVRLANEGYKNATGLHGN